jgi:hypothetical protein
MLHVTQYICNMETSRRTYQYIAFSIIIVAIIACTTSLVLRPHVDVSDITVARLRTASALGVTVTTLGGSFMLLGGVSSFKKQMRAAYMLLAGGIMLFGIALLQLPVVGFYDLWNTWYANSGVLVLPFLCATALIYAGVRRFARLLGVDTILTSFTLVTCLTIVIAIVSFIGGHYLSRYRLTPGTDTFIAVVGWSSSFCTCAVLLLRRTIMRIGPLYQPVMRSLLIALAALALSGWHEYFIDYFLGNPDWYISHGLSFIPFIISGVLMVWAGYRLCVFYTGGDAADNDSTATAVSTTVNDAEYTNAITYAASLASHPLDIDFILDDLRLVTSNLERDQALSPDDKRRLINVYLKVELFLIYHDPLRNFNRDEIRSKFSPGLQAELAEHTPNDAATKVSPAIA